MILDVMVHSVVVSQSPGGVSEVLHFAQLKAHIPSVATRRRHAVVQDAWEKVLGRERLAFRVVVSLLFTFSLEIATALDFWGTALWKMRNAADETASPSLRCRNGEQQL